MGIEAIVNESEVLDYGRFDEIARTRRDEFVNARPFPHIVIDDFLAPDVAAAVHAEFDSTEQGWDHYRHYNEDKIALTNLAGMAPNTRSLVDALISRRFVDFVEALCGLPDLIADPELDGAGLHKVPSGGFLNMHTDFLSHTVHHNWSRQINLLLYFNPDWQPSYRGGLELWDAEMKGCEARVEPVYNRCVLFHTTDTSYHGHPHALACPEGVERKSIALYYFRIENETQQLTSTHYQARPDDPLLKRVLVAADRTALRAYSFLRRHTGLSDSMISRILKRF